MKLRAKSLGQQKHNGRSAKGGVSMWQFWWRRQAQRKGFNWRSGNVIPYGANIILFSGARKPGAKEHPLAKDNLPNRQPLPNKDRQIEIRNPQVAQTEKQIDVRGPNLQKGKQASQ